MWKYSGVKCHFMYTCMGWGEQYIWQNVNYSIQVESTYLSIHCASLSTFSGCVEFFNIKKEEKKKRPVKNLGTSIQQEKEFFGGKTGSTYQKSNFKKGAIKQNGGCK